MGGLCKKQADTEVYSNCEQADWLYIAAKYYDKAISFLREGLMVYHTPLQQPNSGSSRRSSLSRYGDNDGESFQVVLQRSRRMTYLPPRQYSLSTNSWMIQALSGHGMFASPQTRILSNRLVVISVA
jgi:hypothetical protein